MLRENDERRARLFQLQDEINELIRLETPIWDRIDAVENPGTDRDDYALLGRLHGELELIAKEIRMKVAERDALSDELGFRRPRVAR
jgi:hypothetical protein